MSSDTNVAVCSRSFSAHKVLRAELLARYPSTKFNDAGASLAGESLIAFLTGCEKAVVALERVDEAILSQLPELKVIAKVGVGLDMLDLDAMARREVKLGWTAGVNRRSVAELALILILASLRHVVTVNRDVVAGIWKQRSGTELTGKVVGIIGLGHIGRELVSLLAPFNCRLLAHDVVEQTAFCETQHITQVSLERLLSESDVVSLHLALSDSTRGILDAAQIARMKSSSVLVNTARGGLVDELALKEALKAGRLRAAAFDVFADEPPRDSELLKLPNFLGTAHISGSTEEAVLAMGRAAIAGLDNNSVPSST